MTRAKGPSVSPSMLRERPNDARVERIWARLGPTLEGAGNGARARRRVGTYLVAAAVAAAFAGGVLVGAVARPHQGSPPIAALEHGDAEMVDVLAAGSEGRSFPLPGGGRLSLLPGATVELDRAGGSTVTLKLLQGAASVDTVVGARALVIVAGETRLSAQGGSVLDVRRNQDELDVGVVDGAVSIVSPGGTETLARGERADGVPIHVATSSASRPVGHHPRAASVQRRPSAVASAKPSSAPPTPDWLARANAGQDVEALVLLRQQQGGLDAAIRSARSAGELMSIRDVARKGGDPRAVIDALRRVVDSFPDEQHAQLAAYELGTIYERAGDTEKAKSYFERSKSLAPRGALAEDAFCRQIRAVAEAGNKEEAARLAREYLGKYPDGQCKGEVEGFLAGADGAVDPRSPGVVARPPLE